MGWINNQSLPACEGWIIALQFDELRGLPTDGYYRALAYPTDDKPTDRVYAVQAGCACGWRGARVRVVLGTVTWQPPFSPRAPEKLEATLRLAWLSHSLEFAHRDCGRRCGANCPATKTDADRHAHRFCRLYRNSRRIASLIPTTEKVEVPEVLPEPACPRNDSKCT